MCKSAPLGQREIRDSHHGVCASRSSPYSFQVLTSRTLGRSSPRMLSPNSLVYMAYMILFPSFRNAVDDDQIRSILHWLHYRQRISVRTDYKSSNQWCSPYLVGTPGPNNG